MSQGYDQLVSGTDRINQIYAKINTNTEAIKSQFSGTSVPPSPVAGQPFWDTTLKTLSVFDGVSWIDFTNASPAVIALTTEMIDARGTAVSLGAKLDISMNPDGTMKDTLPVGNWWMDEPDTPSYIGSTSFSLSGDKTAVYTPRRAIYLNQTTDDYGFVVSAIFGGGITTIVVEDAVVDVGIISLQFGQPVNNTPQTSIPANVLVDGDIGTTVLAPDGDGSSLTDVPGDVLQLGSSSRF